MMINHCQPANLSLIPRSMFFVSSVQQGETIIKNLILSGVDVMMHTVDYHVKKQGPRESATTYSIGTIQ